MKACFTHCKDETDIFYPEKNVDCRFNGAYAEALDFIMKYQLMRPDLWKKFVNLYRIQPDAEHGWTGEYWGKMMRGACWCYAYNHDAELYALLRQSVLELIGCAETCGRISTYIRPLEFRGWDMWCRKYVLLGLEYFYEICPEAELRKQIKKAMMRHLDYIVARIGNGLGQTPIDRTSDYWQGANSSSILEPTMKLYKLTGKKEYLAFADYIVSAGACAGDNSLFELAYRDEMPPFRYPVNKAYEVMSCFEGLIEYYRVTREEKWRTAALNFGRRVRLVEKSIIGCCGSMEEQFDGAALHQTATEHFWIMQETCVTVTWMKLAGQLLRLSGDSAYADCIEESFYNAYLGALNTHHNASVERIQADGLNAKHPEDLPKPEVLTFDSYSPLLSGVRGQMVGGYNVMPDNTFYGCCACIGSAGIGLLPQVAVMHNAAGPVLNLYFPGDTSVQTPAGQHLTLHLDADYPYGNGVISIKLSLPAPEAFALTLRIPAWSRSTSLTVNGEAMEVNDTGYHSFARTWQDGDTLVLTPDMRTFAVRPPQGACDEDSFLAYRRGPILLGADVRLGIDPAADYAIAQDSDGVIAAVPASCTEVPDSHLCLVMPMANGSTIRLIDYASTGKTWDESSRCAVWLHN